MSRTASRERSTAETQIRLSLDLDGGESSAATGRRLPRPHARPARPPRQAGAEVEANGDLETGAHHTVEDVGIVLGQALDEALGDRAGIRRYGSAVVPMDESLAECAIDISGPAALRLRRRPADDLDRRLRHRAGRGVLPRRRQQRQADPARLGPLRHQRPPHDRGLLQGLRPRPARRGLGRPRGERRAFDQGDA